MRRTRAARCRHALLTEHVLDGHFGDGREPGAGRVALVGAGARTPRGGTALGRVYFTASQNRRLKLYFFPRARAERKAASASEAVGSHIDRRSRSPHHPTDTRLSHYDTSSIMVCNETRCVVTKHNAVLAMVLCYHHLYPAMVWLSRSRERRVIPARSVERQSRGRPHGGAPQWRGDRAHSRGARRPHGHLLWSFPRVLRRDRLPESQELARVF